MIRILFHSGGIGRLGKSRRGHQSRPEKAWQIPKSIIGRTSPVGIAGSRCAMFWPVRSAAPKAALDTMARDAFEAGLYDTQRFRKVAAANSGGQGKFPTAVLDACVPADAARGHIGVGWGFFNRPFWDHCTGAESALQILRRQSSEDPAM